jgi:hypothetical protein
MKASLPLVLKPCNEEGKMNRLASFIGVVLLVSLTAIGCGTTPTPEVSPEPTEMLSVAFPEWAQDEWLSWTEEHPGVELKLEALPSQDYIDILLARVQAGEAPDAAMVPYLPRAFAAWSSLFPDLADYQGRFHEEGRGGLRSYHGDILGVVFPPTPGWLLVPLSDKESVIDLLVTAAPQIPPTIAHFSDLEDLIQAFITESELPITLEGIESYQEVSSENRESIIEEIIDETVFLDIVDSELIITSFQEYGTGEDYDLYRWILTLEGYPFLYDGQRSIWDMAVSDGDVVARIDWGSEEGAFTTLATVDENGVPKFEPILYFNVISTKPSQPAAAIIEANPTVSVEEYDSVENGFGWKAVEWRIKVSFVTSDNCTIEGNTPATTVKFYTLPGFQAVAAKQGSTFCHTKEECECGGQANKQECYQAEIKIGMASGFKSVKVKAGEFEIEVSGILGATAQEEEVIILCADGTTL